MSNPIIFKQERDFGEIFNATFAFIGQEYKRLGKVILFFVMPFLLIASIGQTWYSIRAQEIQQTMTNNINPDNPFAAFATMGSLFGSMFIFILLILIASTIMTISVYGYIKLYNDNGTDGFTIQDVWMLVVKNFLKYLGVSFVVGIVVGIGLGFCLIPGIYLGVALCLVFAIMMFENKPFGDSFSRSWKLVNPNWWQTFGICIVTIIMIWIMSLLLSIPSFIFGFKSIFTVFKTQEFGGHSTTFYIVNSIVQLLSYVLQAIPLIITSFIYFSYVEQLEKPSLMDKINQINSDETSTIPKNTEGHD